MAQKLTYCLIFLQLTAAAAAAAELVTATALLFSAEMTTMAKKR